jgi:capsular polysaccharide biosynthesis protein
MTAADDRTPSVLTQATVADASTTALGALRSGWWLIALCLSLGIGVALVYLAVAPRTYQATADLLVTPLSRDDRTFDGIDVVRDSSDPTRDIETVARLAKTLSVAARVNASNGGAETAHDVLARVSVQPVAQSSVVAVTARASTADAAARLANAYALAVVATRNSVIRREIAATVRALNRQIAARNSTPTLKARVQTLKAVSSLGDPTVHRAAPAAVPTGYSSPRPLLSVLAGVLVGGLIGLAGAFGIQFVRPRVNSATDLLPWGIPILLHVPLRRAAIEDGQVASQTPEERVAAPLRLVGEYFAVLDGAGAVLTVTSAGESEGKSAIATALASGLSHKMQVHTVRAADGKTVPELRDVSIAARGRGEYVVLDAPSAANPVLLLSWARESDAILVAVRYRKSSLSELRRLIELLASDGLRPAGFITSS